MRRTKSWMILGVLIAFATGTVGATASEQRAAAGPSYKVVGKWGGPGAANGKFTGPHGITTDEAGNVYVADTDNRRVQVFSASGAFLRKWGSIGSGNGQFSSAQDVAAGPDGNVWVADYSGVRIQWFTSGGAHQGTIGVGGQPVGIAVDGKGSVFVSTNRDTGTPDRVQRYDKTPTGYVLGTTWGGIQEVGDVEVSPDGSVYVADLRGAPPTVKRFDSSGKLLKTIKLDLPATAGAGAGVGIGVDPDCNVWTTNAPNRDLERYSPTGKLLGTAASPDLVAQDVAVGPRGDLYAIHYTSIVHFAEDKAKPATANVPGTIRVANGKAKMRFGLPSVACPAQVDATATLTGKGVSGRATLKVGAGKFTVIDMNVKAPAGKTTPALFKIVLKTNGRPTTQTKSVKVSFAN